VRSLDGEGRHYRGERLFRKLIPGRHFRLGRGGLSRGGLSERNPAENWTSTLGGEGKTKTNKGKINLKRDWGGNRILKKELFGGSNDYS